MRIQPISTTGGVLASLKRTQELPNPELPTFF